jgi:hypothetical protein
MPTATMEFVSSGKLTKPLKFGVKQVGVHKPFLKQPEGSHTDANCSVEKLPSCYVEAIAEMAVPYGGRHDACLEPKDVQRWQLART